MTTFYVVRSPRPARPFSFGLLDGREYASVDLT